VKTKKERSHSRRNLAIALFLIAVMVVVLIVGTIVIVGYANPNKSTTTYFGPVGNAHAAIWQDLYITNVDGSAYWYNAPEPISLSVIASTLSGSQSGQASNFTAVSEVQNRIFMWINNTLAPVSSWSLTCSEDITIQDLHHNILTDVTSVRSGNGPASISVSGGSETTGTTLWVTGASIDAADLLPYINQPPGTYYFVITLSNIVLTINGQQYTPMSVTSANTLQWLIKLS